MFSTATDDQVHQVTFDKNEEKKISEEFLNQEKEIIHSDNRVKSTLKPFDNESQYQSDENFIDFPIALISAKGQFHQNKEKLTKEIKLLHSAYNSSSMPIVYVFGDTVYKNSEISDQELERSNSTWRKKYNSAINEIYSNGEVIKETVVSWNTVKRDDSYFKIKMFVDLVFDLTINIEKFQEAFPTVQDKTILGKLLEEVKALNLEENLINITEEFKKKNLLKVVKKQKKEKGIIKKNQEIDRLVESKLATLLPSQLIPSVEVNHNQTEQVENLFLQQTLGFLREEYAVFMNLSLPKNTREMGVKCGLSLDQEKQIRPLLHYPITCTDGSRLIFHTFRLIESKYIEYCRKLSLPAIDSPVVVLDVIISDAILSEKESAAKTEKVGFKSDSNQALTELHISENSTNKTINYSDNLFSFYKEPSITQEIKETTKKIILLIDDLYFSFLQGIPMDTLIKYKNVIDCDISVRTSIKYQVDDDSRNWANQRDLVASAIARAIYRIKNDNIEISTDIHYLGYNISLSMRSPQPFLNLVS